MKECYYPLPPRRDAPISSSIKNTSVLQHCFLSFSLLHIYRLYLNLIYLLFNAICSFIYHIYHLFQVMTYVKDIRPHFIFIILQIFEKALR